MPSVPYGSRTYQRSNGNFPELNLINMFLERALTSENQVALISRPGLGLLATVGASPINGMFCKAGTLSGDVFSIGNATIYRGTSSVGSIAGSGVASWAGGFGELLVTRGTVCRNYDGTTLANVTFPDTANVRAVAFIGSLFVAVRGDASGKFYWSAPLDGTSWDALDFATAEREPDSLLDIAALGDNIWLFGQQTIESWAHTGDAALPFTRIEQVAFDQGIMDTGCVVPADNTLFFIGSKRVVYRLGQVPERISDHGIEERLLASTTARLFTFWYQGHEMIAMRLDSETLVYDCSTQEWCEFQSSGANWIVAYAAMQGKTAYFGHATTGELMGWSEWDDMGAAMERRFAFAQQLDNPLSIDRLQLWVNSGETDVLSGTGSSPVASLRLSDDAGRTWGDWEDTDIGDAFEYRAVPEWRALGMFDFPGLVGEIKCSDPVPFRVSAIKINERGGGRSRQAETPVGLLIANRTNTTVTDTGGGVYEIHKTGGVDGNYDADAIGSIAITGDFSLRLEHISGAWAAGMDTDPAVNSSYVFLDFWFLYDGGWYVNGGGGLIVSPAAYGWIWRSSGTVYLGLGTTQAAAAVSPLASSANTSTLYFDSSMKTAGAKVRAYLVGNY